MAKRVKGRRALPKSATPAERDAYWLKQFRAIESDGVPIKVYAEREGLAVQSLYQARKRLVKRGVLPRTRGAIRKFGRVRLVELAEHGRRCRLRVGGNAVVEWDEGPSVEVLAALLKQVVQPG
jgi:DNA-binding MarR family transcriptional regulator